MTARLVRTHAELLAARIPGREIAVVMTMGALHEGHAQLVREARALVGPQGSVIVTVFVNPLQFAVGEDFDRYPRTLEADIEVCDGAGADLVYAPEVAEIYGIDYPDGPQVTIDAGPLGDVLDGVTRKGHFDGALTVIAKFLNLTAAAYAMFGEKDYQQLTVVTQMVEQLKFPTRIVPVATVREPDGLAMSSRNRYLSADDRRIAAVIPRALQATVEEAARSGADAGIAAGLAVLASEPSISVEYLTITDPMLGPAAPGAARALIAVRLGRTRLIDNMACTVGGAS